MDNVQSTTLAPAATPSKIAATGAPADTDDATPPGAFMAVLAQQLKSLKAALTPAHDAAAAGAKCADPTQDAQDARATTDPAAAATPLPAGLAPALIAAHVPPAAATGAAADCVDAKSQPAQGADTANAAVASAVSGVLAALTAAPSLAGKAAASQGDAHAAADTRADFAAAPARRNEADNAVEPRLAPARDPLAAAATELAARTELLRGAEHAPARDADRRDANAQTAPQIASFMQTLQDARAASSAAPAAQLQIDSAVGSAGWSTELGQRVVWMVGEKQHVAELHVNPPDLGPIGIKLTVDNQQTTAVFTSPHAAVRDAVESALPHLREVLAESGIMLGNASVTADSPRDGSAFGAPPAPPSAARNDGTDAGAAPAPSAAIATARALGLVDLFA